MDGNRSWGRKNGGKGSNASLGLVYDDGRDHSAISLEDGCTGSNTSRYHVTCLHRSSIEHPTNDVHLTTANGLLY